MFQSEQRDLATGDRIVNHDLDLKIAERGTIESLDGRMATIRWDPDERVITAAFHDRMAAQWREERDRSLHDMESYLTAEDSQIDDAMALLDVARNAHRGFAEVPLASKRRARKNR